MPGNPQGRDINESGPKGITLVTVEEDGTIACEERPVAVAVFERLSVDLAGIDDWRGMQERAEAVLAAALAATGGAHLVARLTLAGATPLAWRLRRDEDLLLAELQNIAASLGSGWIEAVELAVTAPPVAEGIDAGPLSELSRLMHADVTLSHAYREELCEMLADLLRQLPKEARHLLVPDEAAEEGLIAELAREGADTASSPSAASISARPGRASRISISCTARTRPASRRSFPPISTFSSASRRRVPTASCILMR